MIDAHTLTILWQMLHGRRLVDRMEAAYIALNSKDECLTLILKFSNIINIIIYIIIYNRFFSLLKFRFYNVIFFDLFRISIILLQYLINNVSLYIVHLDIY